MDQWLSKLVSSVMQSIQHVGWWQVPETRHKRYYGFMDVLTATSSHNEHAMEDGAADWFMYMQVDILITIGTVRSFHSHWLRNICIFIVDGIHIIPSSNSSAQDHGNGVKIQSGVIILVKEQTFICVKNQDKSMVIFRTPVSMPKTRKKITHDTKNRWMIPNVLLFFLSWQQRGILKASIGITNFYKKKVILLKAIWQI